MDIFILETNDHVQIRYNLAVLLIESQGLNCITSTYINSDKINKMYDQMSQICKMDNRIEKNIKRGIVFLKSMSVMFLFVITGYFVMMVCETYCGNVGKLCGFLSPIVSV